MYKCTYMCKYIYHKQLFFNLYVTSEIFGSHKGHKTLHCPGQRRTWQTVCVFPASASCQDGSLPLSEVSPVVSCGPEAEDPPSDLSLEGHC